MNKNQTIALWAGVAAAVYVLLVPPYEGRPQTSFLSTNYGAPEMGRLIPELAVIALITAALFFTLRRRPD